MPGRELNQGAVRGGRGLVGGRGGKESLTELSIIFGTGWKIT